MKYLIVLAVFVGTCFALPQQRRPDYQQPEEYQDRPQQPAQHEPRRSESSTFIPIIRFDKEQGSDGSYKASYETGNNIIANEEGFLKDLGPDPDSKDGETLNAQVQQGSYTYTSPDGQIITVNYIADETGFHPSGDHLPTPPPVSPEVQKGLDLIYAGIKAQAEEDARNPQNQRENQNQNY